MAPFENISIVTIHPVYPPRPIQFSTVLTLMIFSIPCYIFVLYHFLTNRTLYTALNNHVIILLLIINGMQTVTDVPSFLSYYYTGIIWPATVNYCLFRYFIDCYFFTTCFLLLTWASFERHILIFHMQYYSTRMKRCIRHYLPLCLCFIYPFVYYVVFLFFYPCENYYDVSIASCFAPCYIWVSSLLALYEQIAHGLALMLIVFIFNVSLIIRVLQQQRKMGRQMTWRKNRKMTMQLLSVCCLFYLTNGGYFIIQIGRFLQSQNFAQNIAGWIFPLSMCMPPLMPFFCLSSLTDLKQKIKMIIPWWRHIRVVPAIINMPATQSNGIASNRRQNA